MRQRALSFLLPVLFACTSENADAPLEDRFADQRLVSYEAVPSAQSWRWGEVDFSMTTYEARAALTHDAHVQLYPEILDAIALDCATPDTQETPGGYLLQTNPSLQTAIPVADCSREEVQRLAAALGYAFRQWDVLVTDFSATAGGTGYATVSFPEGSLTPQLAQSFFTHAADTHEGLGGGYTAFDDAMLFLNLRDSDGGTPYSGLEDHAFITALDQAAGSFEEADVEVQGSAEGTLDATFVSNDWDAAPVGEGFAAMLEPAEVARLDAIAAEHDQLVIDRFGSNAGTGS